MNKKAVDFRTLTFLFAVIIIAILVLIFYAWQGKEGSEAEKRIRIDSETVHKNHVLIDLLNAPIDSDKTIGDAISQGELTKACKEVKDMIAVLYGENKLFVLEFDGSEFCESPKSPEKAITLKAWIPTMGTEVKEVSLEI